ncbi:MAG: DR2241 family protein [Haloferacaceae archaeon]
MRDERIDALVGAASDGDGVECDGLVVERRPDGYALGTPEGDRAGLSEAELRDALAAHPRLVSNWFHWRRRLGGMGASRRAFLRWIERAGERGVGERYDALADGTAREWGQLRVTARLDGAGGDAAGGGTGERRYDLRHVADAGAAAADLDAREDPYAARDIAKFDERGRYRPLKTAPSLRSGWVYPDLDGPDLVETVGVVYPATVANWHREREGDLDVTHWRETAERQTGIYDVVEELPDEAVAWVAEACCVDSQCLKRREWDRSADDPIGVDRGDGPFPCREPCSLVVAAARKWTTLEREGTRTYEFDLTPSEKEQVEAIVEAVADGRVDEIREADVYEGANRYRARYLRAKRFDGAGNLSGTPTDPDGGKTVDGDGDSDGDGDESETGDGDGD